MDAMELIAITTPYFYPGEAEAIADALLNRGFSRVHIRKPGATSADMYRLLSAVPQALYPRLSLHDCFAVAKEMGIGGVHINSRNPAAPQGWDGIVSRSIHSVEEIAGVTEDYAFISPVFPSISKPGYTPQFALEELTPHLHRRIFALGGVTPDRLPVLEKAGFGGAAMLGAVWSKPIDHEAFKLQFITHPDENRSMADEALEVLRGGCRWVQLRHKDADMQQLAKEGEECRRLCHESGAIFIIDDHVEFVNRTGADGVHLGKNDMSVAEARAIIGPAKIIGATANTFADIREAARQGADYIGLGPFRFTQTKKNLSPVLGTEGYRSILSQCRQEGINLPVVAIGGITDDDIPAIMSTGVEGIALSSSILQAADPQRQTEMTLKTIIKTKVRSKK